MELPDCPPGAEGYEDTVVEMAKKPELDDSTSTKAELEFKEHLASLKIKVENGSTRSMAERRGRDVSGKWIYLCYPCAAVCSGESILQTHISGKKHKAKLSQKNVWPESIFDDHPYIKSERGVGHNASEQTLQKMAIEVNNHNTDPTEMDQRFSRFRYERCLLQKTLDQVKAPLLGLEYLVEFPPEQSHHEPAYICLLCDKQGAPRTIINHLVCHIHRIKYLRNHFNVTHELLNPFRSNPQYREGVSIVLNRLAQRIEDTYGRLKPLVIDKDEYRANKDQVSQWVWKSYHFSDKNGVTFAEVVDKDLITSLIPGDPKAAKDLKKRDPSPPVVAAPSKPSYRSDSQRRERRRDRRALSIESLSDISMEERDPRRSPRPRSKRERDLPHRTAYSSYRSSADSRSRPPPASKRRSRSPLHRYTNKSDKSRPANFDYKMEILKEQLRHAESAAGKTLAYHEKNPEKHPLYPEEWKKFWNRRYKELQTENKDPTKYDYKPEWIVYWTKRMKELHEQELKSEVAEIHRKLNLPVPEDRRLRSPLRLSPGRRSRSPLHRNRSPVKSPQRSNPYTWTRKDRRSPLKVKESSLKEAKQPSRNRGRNSAMTPAKTPALQTVLVSDDDLKPEDVLSPWNDSDSLNSLGSLPDAKSPLNRSRAGSAFSRSQASDRGRHRMVSDDPHPSDNNSPDDVVSALRLLVALEDYLGSLGPKIVDLLTQALKMEKEAPNSSEKMLENEMCVALIETAKEKLKGAVQAGLVPSGAGSAAKKAVTRAAALLHVADRRMQKKKLEVAASSREGVAVAGVGAVDKAAIAKQMAAALIAQGKTDVSTEELAQLVDAVVGMAEAKKREAGKEVIRNPVRLPAVSREPSASALQLLQTAYDENDKKIEKPPPEEVPDVMDGLSDSDLKTLLQNFSELSAEEQHGLIAYLKKLEAKSPKRVERLREYVSAAVSVAEENEAKEAALAEMEVQEPQEVEPADKSPAPEETSVPMIIESDDDDYSVEEVFQSAAQKVKENQIRQEMEVVQKFLSQEPHTKPAPASKPPNNTPTSIKVMSSAANVLSLAQASVHVSSAVSRSAAVAPSLPIPDTADVSVSSVVQTNSQPRSFGDKGINPAPAVFNRMPVDQSADNYFGSPAQDFGHMEPMANMQNPNVNMYHEYAQQPRVPVAQHSQDNNQWEGQDTQWSPNNNSYNAGPNYGMQGMKPNHGGQGMAPNRGAQGVAPNHGSQSLAPKHGPHGMAPNHGPQGMAPNHGPQGMAPNRGPQGMAPNHGPQGMAPNHSPQGMGPNHGPQGMAPNRSAHGMTPNHGLQGMAPNDGPQGMVPNHGPQGMVPNHGPQGMAPNHVTQGMAPNHGPQGMVPKNSYGVQSMAPNVNYGSRPYLDNMNNAPHRNENVTDIYTQGGAMPGNYSQQQYNMNIPQVDMHPQPFNLDQSYGNSYGGNNNYPIDNYSRGGRGQPRVWGPGGRGRGGRGNYGGY